MTRGEMRAMLRLLGAILGEDNCWEWQKALTPDGYAVWHTPDGRGRQGHRLVYELLEAPITDGLELDHLCRNRRCVNPAHMEPVTHEVNTARAKAAREHCLRGHLWTPENTLRRANGTRQCRACNKIRRARQHQERRAA
jgi:hypothetical protein